MMISSNNNNSRSGDLKLKLKERKEKFWTGGPVRPAAAWRSATQRCHASAVCVAGRGALFFFFVFEDLDF
jgi:hypothetical protein